MNVFQHTPPKVFSDADNIDILMTILTYFMLKFSPLVFQLLVLTHPVNSSCGKKTQRVSVIISFYVCFNTRQ